MINEKYKNGVVVLEELAEDEDKCIVLYDSIVDLYINNIINEKLLEQYMLFLINTYHSIENMTLRKCALRYLSLPIWTSLSTTRLFIELENNEKIANHWNAFQKQKQYIEQQQIQTKSIDTISSTNSANLPQKKSKVMQVSVDKLTSTIVQVSIDQLNKDQKQYTDMNRDIQWMPSIITSFITHVTNSKKG